MQIEDIPSPNHGPRRDGARPKLVMIHYTAMDTEEAAIERLCTPIFEVSAHYLIGPSGRVVRLVPEEARAWHAGRGAWGTIGDINSHAIGIELANDGRSPFAAPQMDALETLLDALRDRWGIGPACVLGHSDTAPDRKNDPGARFDWRRLARGGRALWPRDLAPAEADAARFADAARRFGYRGEAGHILRAVRLRFRPWALDRPLEAEDVAIIEALARDHPFVDPVPATP